MVQSGVALNSPVHNASIVTPDIVPWDILCFGMVKRGAQQQPGYTKAK